MRRQNIPPVGFQIQFRPLLQSYWWNRPLWSASILSVGLSLGFGYVLPIAANPIPTVNVSSEPIIAQRSSQDLGKVLREARDKIEDGLYAEAIVLYNQAAQIAPDNARIFSGLAYAYTQLNRFPEAITAFRQALSLDDRNPDFYYGLAFSLSQVGDHGAAANAYRQVINLDRNRTDAYLGLGFVLEQEGDWAAATDIYQQLIRLQPREARAYDAAGAVLVKQRRFQEALPLLQKAAELVPNSPGTLINLSITWIGLNNPEQGIQTLEQAQRLNPRDGSIYAKLGEILYTTGQPEQALEIYRQALRLDPQQSLPRQRIVEILLALPDYVRAIVNARLWTEASPNDPNAYRYLGLALQGRTRPTEALEAWGIAKTLYQRQGNGQGVQDIENLERSLRGSHFNPNK